MTTLTTGAFQFFNIHEATELWGRIIGITIPRQFIACGLPVAFAVRGEKFQIHQPGHMNL